MGVVAEVLSLQNAQQEGVAWRLLRAKSAPLILAILEEHLGGDTPRRPVSELQELVAIDLAELGMRIPELEIKRSARAYLEKWRNDGYLVCRPSEKARQETYELSAGAISAIAFVKNLEKPHRSATRSRLSLILDQVSSLSLSVDGDVERRRRALLDERARIDAQIAALLAGNLQEGSVSDALEQVREIIALSREIPRDFVNVAGDFERISKELFRSLILDEGESKEILENVFAGVDQIGQSAAGRTFKGFYELLRDIEATERFQDDVDIILDADFAAMMEPEDRRFLRRFIQNSLTNSREVNETLTGLARGLRRFVQSQSFQQERRIKRLIEQALARANEITEFMPPSASVQTSLELTSTPIAPISRLALYDPSERMASSVIVTEEDEAAPLSLEELRFLVREVEIDYKELVTNVNKSLDATSSGDVGEDQFAAVSVGEVLDRFPATQGLASVVGLMNLALDQGEGRSGVDVVAWTSREGRRRSARVEKLLFSRKVSL